MENQNDPYANKNDPEIEHMNKYYTSMWNEVTETFNAMFPLIWKKLKTKGVIPLNQLLCLNYGMSQGEVIDHQLTRMIQNKMQESVKRGEFVLDTNDLIYGMQGLANSTINSTVTRQVTSAILPQVDQINIFNLNLNEKLRLAWGLSLLERFDSQVLKDLVADFELMPFENAQNELLFEEFEMLRDIYLSLEHLNVDQSMKIKNRNIRSLVARSQEILKDYPEAHPKIDPFKPKLLKGLTKCLAKLGSDSLENAEGLMFQTDSEAAKMNKHLYPYKPDLLFRHKNETIALWLVNRSKYQTAGGLENTNPKGTPFTGAQLFQQKLLRKLNPHRNIKNVYICVEDMVSYDLKNMKTEINENALSKLKFLNDAQNDIPMDDLLSLSNWAIKQKEDTSLMNTFKADDASREKFYDLLHDFVSTRQAKHNRFLNTNSNDSNNLKTILMKLNLVWEGMPESMKSSVDEFVQSRGHLDFTTFLLKIKDSIDQEIQLHQNEVDPQLDTSWIGKRFGVELPSSTAHSQNDTKDIGTEMLNRKFMW